VRSGKWLKHRFELFERYCFPSICGQTCKDFGWIVLFDSTTPLKYKERIEGYKKDFPQLIPVFVEPKQGRYFADIFRQEVIKRVKSVLKVQDSSKQLRVLTTYLDNDDALSIHFVEDIQKRALSLNDGTFINYTHGCQLYTDSYYMIQVINHRNHFISVIEPSIPTLLKTVYGYGSHYYIEKIRGVRIEYVKNIPMWCEVIHEKNMDNDAYFLFGSKTVKDRDYIRNNYSIDQTLNIGGNIYMFHFLPRYMRVFVRRIKYFFFGRHW